MTKKKLPDPTDPRAIAIEFLRRLGGMTGMEKWGKTHRSLAYQLIAKLLAQPTTQTNVQVNIANDGEAARQKLADAFQRSIDARGKDTGAVFVDGERVYDGHVIDANVIDANVIDANVIDARAKAINPPQSAATDPASRDPAQQPAAPDADGDSFGTVCSSAATAVAAPDRPDKPFHPAARPQAAPREPSTTQLYLDWVAHGGGGRFGGT